MAGCDPLTDILSPYSRRGLIGAGLGVGAGLLLPDSAMSASRPRRGGRIRAAGMTASTADTLDPAKGANSSDYIRHYMFYSLLTQLDRNLIPWLPYHAPPTGEGQVATARGEHNGGHGHTATAQNL